MPKNLTTTTTTIPPPSEDYMLEDYEYEDDIYKKVYNISTRITLILQILTVIVNLLHLIVLFRKDLRTIAIFILMIGIALSDIITSITEFLGSAAEIEWIPILFPGSGEMSCLRDDYLEVNIGQQAIATSRDISRRLSVWLSILMAAIRSLTVFFPMSQRIQNMTKPKGAVITLTLCVLFWTVFNTWHFVFYRIFWLPDNANKLLDDVPSLSYLDCSDCSACAVHIGQFVQFRLCSLPESEKLPISSWAIYLVLASCLVENGQLVKFRLCIFLVQIVQLAWLRCLSMFKSLILPKHILAAPLGLKEQMSNWGFIEFIMKFVATICYPILTISLLATLRAIKKKRKNLQKKETDQSDNTTKLILFMTILFMFSEGLEGLEALLLYNLERIVGYNEELSQVGQSRQVAQSRQVFVPYELGKLPNLGKLANLSWASCPI
ncbi:unnamed protein product [Caenorhabditis brenneri]